MIANGDKLKNSIQEPGAEKVQLGLKWSIRINWKATSTCDE